MVRTLLLLALVAPAVAHADDEPDGDVSPTPVEIVRMPSVAEWVQAPFPDAAAEAGILEARVVLRISIDEDGQVVGVQVTESAGNGFDEAARQAVEAMSFEPALGPDGPIPVTFDFAYNFRLEEVPADPEAPAPITLEGLVREQGTRAPVTEALVRVRWAGEGPPPTPPFEVLTESDGTFALRGVPAGRWRVAVSGPFHLPFATDVDIVEGEVTTVDAWLRVDSTSDNEIVVFGERERPPEITRRTLSTEEIRRIPGTFGDPVKVVQTLPGAARSPFGTGLLIIRGANPEDSGVYVDGIRIPLIYHLTGTTSVIAPDLVEAVDYLPGGYAARFGRTSAGTIDVRTKQSIDETKVSVGADVLDAQAYVQTNVPVREVDGETRSLGVAVGGRRSYIDAFLPLFLDSESFSINPRYWDYQLKLIAPTPAHRTLSLFVYGFDDTLTVSSPEERAQGSDADTQGDLLTKYNSHRVILRWDERLRDGLTFRLTPSLGVDRTLFGVGQTFTLDGTTTNVQIRAALEWKASEALTLTPGADFLGGTWAFDFRAPLRLDDLDNPIGERDPVGFGGSGTVWYPDTWLRADLRPLEDRDRLLLTPSVRLNLLHFTYTGEVAGEGKPFTRLSVDPRFSGRFAITDAFAVKASSGFYHQPPQPQESIGLGTTPDLGYERAWNTSLGVEHQVSPAIEWEVEGFWRDMDRLIDVDDSFGGFGTQVFANVGEGRAYGVELIARHHPVGRFFGWVSYTLSRSERRRPGDAAWTAFDFDQTHIFSAQAGYDLPWDLGVSFQVQYVTGNPDTPLDAGVYDVDEGSYNGFRVGAVNGQRLPPFFQTSLRVDKTFVFRSWELATYVDLLNTVRGVNPEFTLYSYDFSESAYVRGLPFIPNVGFEARIRRPGASR
jgi:TonB family protein